MKRICYHDTDPDGFSAAATLLHKYPDMEFIPYNHETRIEPKTVKDYDEVYIVDTSGSQEFMDYLQKHNKEFIWIDHHESSIKALPKYKGIQSTEHSAAYLTWQYCFPEKEVHPIIKHVSDFDLWTFADKNTKSFMLYLDTILEEGKEIEIIEQLLYEQDMNKHYHSGDHLLLFLEKQIQHDIKNNAKGTFQNIPCRYFFQAGKYRSRFAQKAFDTYKDMKLIIMIGIVEINNKPAFKYSLRSTTNDIDCSQICAQFPGGGGHTRAAGFITDKLILE
jgi:nanoRNase/pAp phosphatase (c-di-AMP/oligoRNAs hydrolase)